MRRTSTPSSPSTRTRFESPPASRHRHSWHPHLWHPRHSRHLRHPRHSSDTLGTLATLGTFRHPWHHSSYVADISIVDRRAGQVPASDGRLDRVHGIVA